MVNNKPRAARDIMIYSIGTILRQLVGFIMLPIYTSYLAPADYGIVALLGISVAVFELVLGARFAQVIPRFYYDEADSQSRKKVLSTALTVTALFSCIGVFAIWLGKGPIASALFGSYDYSNYIAIYAVLLFTNGIEAYGLMYLRILEKPILFITVSLVKLLIQLSLNIYLIVYMEIGVMGAILSGVISSSIFCLLFLVLIYGRCGIRVELPLVKKLIIFAWPLWLAGGAAIYMQSSNRFFIRIFSGLDDVGLFELATKFSMILGLLVWQPFANWWQVQRFKILRTSSNMERDFQQIFDMVSTVMVIAIIGIILFSGPIIKIMSTSGFHGASSAILPLTLSVFFSQLSMFFNLSFLAKDKTKTIALLKYCSAIIMTLLYIFMIPAFGIMGAGYALLMTNIILFITTYLLGKKQLDLGVKLHYMMVIALITVCCAVLDLFISSGSSTLVGLVFKKSMLLLVFVAVIISLTAKNESTSSLVNAGWDKAKNKLVRK